MHLELKSMKYVFLEVLLEKFAILLIHRIPNLNEGAYARRGLIALLRGLGE